MVIGHDLMVQIVRMYSFKNQVIQRNGFAVTTNKPIFFLCHKDVTSRKIREAEIQNSELFSTREVAERNLKFLTLTMKMYTLNRFLVMKTI